MSILPGLGYPDKVFGAFSPIDRKGICQAGRGEVSDDVFFSRPSRHRLCKSQHSPGQNLHEYVGRRNLEISTPGMMSFFRGPHDTDSVNPNIRQGRICMNMWAVAI